MIIVIQIYATSLRIYKYLFCRIPLGGRSLPLMTPSSRPFTAGRRRRLFVSSRRTKPYPVPHMSLRSGQACSTSRARAFSRMDKQASSADQAGLPEVGRKKASARSGNGPWAFARVMPCLSVNYFLWASDALLGLSICSHLTIQRGGRRGRKVNACPSSTLSTSPSPAIVGRIQNRADCCIHARATVPR